SGSLPPSFPMTVIDGKSYWDGGLFDNTPLGAVLDRLDPAAGVDRTIYVVNLFPNKAPIPRTMLEVTARTQNLQFANKTAQDVKMLCRIDEVADLMQALELQKVIRLSLHSPDSSLFQPKSATVWHF
ncbi:MAG: patatin-like phospholipase family protein, partial [Xanthobacteraceae bacterium]